jgi:hypothetical protein
MNPGTAVIIDNVEQYAKRRFQYRSEIGTLLEAAEERGMGSAFDELAFIGKFIKNARSILTRDNLDNSVTVRLTDELRANLEKSVRSITTLIENSPSDQKESIARLFLGLRKENVEHLLAMIEELSWFKNYSLDEHNP